MDHYTRLLDGFAREKGEALRELRRDDMLADWIFAVQSQDTLGFDHSWERWSTTEALPWLVASLMTAKGANPRCSEILTAAGAVTADSPAYLTVRFNRARLLAESGRYVEARAELDTLLALSDEDLCTSDHNRLSAMRMRLARDVGEFLTHALRPVRAVVGEFRTDVPTSEATKSLSHSSG